MIKAIVFDMVGPLLRTRPNYVQDPVVDTAEDLYTKNHANVDLLAKLAADPVTRNLSVDEIALKVVSKFEKIEPVWMELLPRLKSKYKLAVLNNGMAITIPFFKKKFNFGQYFEVFINSV